MPSHAVRQWSVPLSQHHGPLNASFMPCHAHFRCPYFLRSLSILPTLLDHVRARLGIGKQLLKAMRETSDE